jgi:hypothetical protein
VGRGRTQEDLRLSSSPSKRMPFSFIKCLPSNRRRINDVVHQGPKRLYILDEGEDVAVVRMLGESLDLWVVEEFTGDGAVRRGTLYRRRWQPRAAITVQ